MRAVRYDSKNGMGQEHRFGTTCIKAVLLSLLAGLLCILVEDSLYDLYAKTLKQGEHDIGSPAGEDVPIVQSIAEMEQNETFTMILPEQYSMSGMVIHGKNYQLVRLPSEELVIARIHKDAVQYVKEPQRLAILPIGQWKRWNEDYSDEPYRYRVEQADTAEFYIDMMGDYAPMYGRERVTDKWRGRLIAIVYFLAFILMRLFGTRRGRIAPALSGKRDVMLAQNDLELWAAGTYALFSKCLRFSEGWIVMGCCHRRAAQRSKIRGVLSELWHIETKEDGLRVVRELIAKSSLGHPNPQMAWDLCSANLLAGMFFQQEWITRAEMDELYIEISTLLQRHYHGWDQLMMDYLRCFERFLSTYPGNLFRIRTLSEAAKRFDAFRALQKGPYAIDWNLNLSYDGRESQYKKQLYDCFQADEL